MDIKSNTSLAESAIYLLKKYASFPLNNALHFCRDEKLKGDDYTLSNTEDTIAISANSAVGFNAAVGKWIRTQSKHTIQKKVHFATEFRSIYFANHFYNFYHSAPIEKVEEYLESLALWGQNILWLWFDLHHFDDIHDKEAEKMLTRMHRIFAKAKELGMQTGLGHIANEFYRVSPQEIKSAYSLENGLYKYKPVGFYHTELCPSTRQGEKLLMQSFYEILQRFADIGLDYIWHWPYDQGGCTCENCYPWGGNGFYHLAKKQASMAKDIFPNVKNVLSTWRFGVFCDGEWDAFITTLQHDESWIDYIIVDIDFYVPDALYTLGIPVVSFPEISMYGAVPWGGYGANPIPKHLQTIIQGNSKYCFGGACYSEGLFEDINKVVCLELFRDPLQNVEDILKEYCAYHFGETHAEDIVAVLLDMEDTLPRMACDDAGNSRDYPVGPQKDLPIIHLKNPDKVSSIRDTWLKIDAALLDAMRNNWRYQILRVRALGDAALLKNKGVPNQQTDKLYESLMNIYFAQDALYCVSPMTRNAILTNKSDGTL